MLQPFLKHPSPPLLWLFPAWSADVPDAARNGVASMIMGQSVRPAYESAATRKASVPWRRAGNNEGMSLALRDPGGSI